MATHRSELSEIVRRVLAEGDQAPAAEPSTPRLTKEEIARKGLRRFFHDVFHIADKYSIYPGVIAAQAAHESSWGRSNAAKTKNNILGIRMRDPEDKTKFVYRPFKSYEECIKYYVKVIESKLTVTDEGRYVREILEEIAGNNYAEDTQYVAKIEQLLKGPTVVFDLDTAYALAERSYFWQYEDELKALGYRTDLIYSKVTGTKKFPGTTK